MVLKKTIRKGLDINDGTGNDKAKLKNTTGTTQQHNEKIKVLEKGKIEKTSASQSTSDHVAPEGGWGWMVALGLIVVFVTVIGPGASFTIVFGDFLESAGQAGSSLTMLNSVFNISYALSSFFTDSLLKRFSMRKVGIIGAILFAIPNVMMAAVQHVFEMGVNFFFQGIGLGLIFTICNTNFNNYFDKKRSMVMGISSVIVGFGGIIYPIVTELLLEKYGFRGTAAITGALSLHCITAMALMRPPATWATKNQNKNSKTQCKDSIKYDFANNNDDAKDKNDDNSDENKKLLPVVTDFLLKQEKTKSLNNDDKWSSCRSLHHDDRSNVKIKSGTRTNSNTDVEGGYHPGRRNSHVDTSFLNKIKLRKPHLVADFTSLSLNNLRIQPALETLNHAALPLRASASAFVRDERHCVDEKNDTTNDDVDNTSQAKEQNSKNGKQSFYDNLIDFTLLKSCSFQNMCIGMSFALTSDYVFTSFLPMMMSNRGFTKADAALTVTVSASAELVSKICLAIFTIFVDAKPKTIFFFAMIAMTLAKVGYIFLEETLTGTMTMVAVIGTVRSWLFVPQPLVVVENLNTDQYAAAYGVFAIVSGVISVIFGPFAGLIKDWTDSFIVCQIVLISMNSLFIIPWAIEMWLERKKKSCDNT